jgi:hypothetical protein
LEQVLIDVFPYAKILDSIINECNPCCETVFYMTWGRKNGDASNCDIWPPVCTYEGMDSLLNLRYRMMADSNDAILSPVGAVWHYIRHNFPSIELYMADESHPSVAGSYAASCCFYSSLFRKDPTLVTFNPSLPPADAANIRAAARMIVYDSLMNWHIGEYDPLANFTYEINDNNQVTFMNSSSNAATYLWDFGDGDTSTLVNPIHYYTLPGLYNVMLTSSKCSMQDTIVQIININSTGITKSPADQSLSWSIYPIPVARELKIEINITVDLNYKIFCWNGVEIQDGTLNNSEKQIPVASLPIGLYFLQIFNNYKSLGQKKFIKD